MYVRVLVVLSVIAGELVSSFEAENVRRQKDCIGGVKKNFAAQARGRLGSTKLTLHGQGYK